MMQPTKTIQTALDLPRTSCDVVVAGGGLTGVCAAIAAAREGANTLLLEATNALGGMATQGMVLGWCGANDGEKVIHSGLAQWFMHHSTPYPGTIDYAKYHHLENKAPIDIEILKRACDRRVLDCGATLRFGSMVSGIQKQENRIDAVVVSSKAGLSLVRAAVFIDCTGDADLAAWAGAPFHKGDETGGLQPVSLLYGISDIDPDALETERFPGWRQRIVEDERYPLIQDDFFSTGAPLSKRVRFTNGGHVYGIDNTDPASMTQGLVQGRRLVAQLHQALKDYFPRSYGDSHLTVSAPLLGVRETRRIVGEHVLTVDEYFAREKFDDTIAFNCFHLDLHPTLQKRKTTQASQTVPGPRRYGPGEYHGIPYRCLIPRGIENLLVAGRSISCERPVLGAVRVMPVCMSMGEAAGIAAAQAIRNRLSDVRQANVRDIRQRLREQGGFMPFFTKELMSPS